MMSKEENVPLSKMRERLNLNDNCRLCAGIETSSLKCSEVIFEDEETVTTLEDILEFIRNDCELLPKRICLQCVRTILQWHDFTQNSVITYVYFKKLLTKEFDLPKENDEVLVFINDVKTQLAHCKAEITQKLSERVRFLNRPKKTQFHRLENGVQKQRRRTRQETECDPPPAKRPFMANKTILGTEQNVSLNIRTIGQSNTMANENEIETNNANLNSNRPTPRVVETSPNPSQGTPPKTTQSAKNVSLTLETPKKDRPAAINNYIQQTPNGTRFDSDHIVDGNAKLVYHLKENELMYVLQTYNLDTEGSFQLLQTRLINHLNTIYSNASQVVGPNVNEIFNPNDDVHDDENDNSCSGNLMETNSEVIEVLLDTDFSAVILDHTYAKQPPPEDFNIEEDIFRPRNNGIINMIFFLEMFSDWDIKLIYRMKKSEILCILDMCNIELEGSIYNMRNKLAKYLNHCRLESTFEDFIARRFSNAETPEISFTISKSKDPVFLMSPGEEPDENPLLGFKSTYIRNILPEPASEVINCDQENVSVESGSQTTSCDKNLVSGYESLSIEREIEKNTFFFPESPNFEFTVKEEHCDDMEICYPATLENSGWMNNKTLLFNSSSAPHASINSQQHHSKRKGNIFSELTDYFESKRINEDINKFKCYVLVNKLPESVVSLFESQRRRRLSSSSSSSSTLTADSSELQDEKSSLRKDSKYM